MGPKATFLHEDKLTVLVRMSGDFTIAQSLKSRYVLSEMSSNCQLNIKQCLQHERCARSMRLNN